MHPDTSVLDELYEAAFVPEFWPRAIAALGAVAGASTGSLMVFDEQQPISFCANEPSAGIIGDLVNDDSWRRNRRMSYWQHHPFTGFVAARDYFPGDVLAEDAAYQRMLRAGFDCQTGTIIPMPTGEVVVFILDRQSEGVPFPAATIERLDGLYPHLARASMMAARLGLERVEVTLAALAGVGFAAAALSRSGTVVGANAAFEASRGLFRIGAHDRVDLQDSQANVLLQAALAAANGDPEPLVRTVPLAGTGESEPVLIHVLPLRGAARDLFSRASTVMIVSPVRTSTLVPSATILTGLFDLTPAEARLAAALAQGEAAADYASTAGIAMPTLRSHLSRIMAKTGTARQAQLVALLKGAGGLAAGR